MGQETIKVGPSLQVCGFTEILKEREKDVKVSYIGGQQTLSDFDIRPYQVTVGFTEHEFQKLQQKAIYEGKVISEFIHDMILQNT
jgi:hypothetical protein